jgi:DNA-binding YbaB/EbfC family protein
MLRQAQQMQAQMAKIQEELAEARTEATAGGGVVKVTIIGGSEVVDPEDIEMLQDLVTAAVNEGMDTAQAEASKKMSAITGGLNIPGLM